MGKVSILFKRLQSCTSLEDCGENGGEIWISNDGGATPTQAGGRQRKGEEIILNFLFLLETIPTLEEGK